MENFSLIDLEGAVICNTGFNSNGDATFCIIDADMASDYMDDGYCSIPLDMLQEYAAIRITVKDAERLKAPDPIKFD